VLIVEYHRISKEEARWDRSTKSFAADLARLYEMGFRPVTVGEYLSGQMNVSPGASPVVITFDDSTPSQFRLLPDGSIDPDCALGIWSRFAARHPDFPIRATFFVLPPTPWGQKRELTAKLKALREWGCEIGSHTATHPNLAKLPLERVKAELAAGIEFVASLGFRADAIALPFGISPNEPSLLRAFTLKGKTYGHRAALLVGAGPAPAPGSPGFNPYRIPRIQGIEGAYGITYWLNRVRKGDVKVYVQP
jgi:hypothetical protein